MDLFRSFKLMTAFLAVVVQSSMTSGMPLGLPPQAEEENETAFELIYKANQELIINHMDHWFEIDIVRDERFEEILKHAVTEEIPEAANRSAEATNTPEQTPEAANTPEQTPEAANTPEQTPEAANTPEQTPEATNTPEQTPEATNTPEQTPEATNTPEQTPEAANRQPRGGLAFPQLLWPGGRVPYLFHGFVRGNVRRKVKAAMKKWEDHTCITFVPKQKGDRDYILFVEMTGCWSYVGKLGGAQKLSLGNNQPFCQRVGVIAHELGHAIGFWHEQSRPDRNEYVTIIWDNIISEARSNFMRYPHGEVDSFNVEYDYGSIMHYPPKAFSKDGGHTIVATRPGIAVMGQRKGPSPLDILQANLMYDCPTPPPPPENHTKNVTSELEIPNEAFLIQLKNTSICLDVREYGHNDSRPSNHSIRISDGFYDIILSKCEPEVIDQYWQWTTNDQLLHIGTYLCLSSNQSGNSLLLRPCNSGDPRQEWYCADGFITLPHSGKCITAQEETDLEEALDSFVDGTMVGVLEDCGDIDQLWEAISNNSVQQSICSFSNNTSHILPRCYVKDITVPAQNWTTCDRIGYYTSGFYHISHHYMNTITGMQCCASSYVFTGAPDSPIATHEEICQEEEWWSYKDTTVSEGWFRCPEGMFLKGFYFSSNEQGLHGIKKAKCCKPDLSRAQYEDRYTDHAQMLMNSGVHACSLTGYYITGVYKTVGSKYDAIEEITCGV